MQAEEDKIMKPLVIIGSAPCLEDDLSRLPGHEKYDHMAIGLSSVNRYHGDIQYVANNHLENIPLIAQIMKERHEACGGNYKYKMICPRMAKGVDIVESYNPKDPPGSSAITGAFAAIRMGYRKIILTGCPLTGNAPAGNPYEEFRQGWDAKQNEVIGIVKSMSGWTKDLLGEPTESWLNPKRCAGNTAEIIIKKECTARWEYLIELADDFGWKRGAELGVWYGATFFKLLESLRNLYLIGVDSWMESDKFTHHKNQAVNMIEVNSRRLSYAGRSEILNMTTEEAAREIPNSSLDFVFIDASHDYNSVFADITNWMPKVKPYGFLVGHDYEWPTVDAAVNDLLSNVHSYKAGSDYMWAWRKP